MPGGDLHVEFEEGVGGYRNVWLSGKASEMKRGVLTLCLAIFSFLSPAQASTQWYDNLSDEAIISVLTASPGDDIYSLFGHTAIRILDPQNLPDADWVFNYGTFSFSDSTSSSTQDPHGWDDFQDGSGMGDQWRIEGSGATVGVHRGLPSLVALQ